ncbi:MAG: tetratricopeptide repeat protein, partial [Planctomycetes bacterium]|nr:tetratricopeptide repeat protein [Planctomycetota bacterium]
RGQAKARQLWKQIERVDTSNVTKVRLKIAQALELEAAASASSGQASDSAKRNQAIALLEQILKDRQNSTATPEAGIDLARLYVQARRFDDAEKTLKFVIDLLGDKRTLIRMELPDEAMVQPQVKAAKAALARLKYERDAGREEFEAAEKLRKQEKWLPAVRAYQAIVKDFADTDYAPRSELHIGDCLLGLGRESQAVAHWKKFIEPKPAGPWRAQAYIRIIDYCLEEQLDLPEAGKYAQLAQSSLAVALRSPKGEAGWQAAAFDVHLRVGLVSLVTGKSDDAVAAFARAKAITDNKTTAERLDALIAAAKSGQGVIPEDCRASGRRGHGVAAGEAGPSDKAALALSMGVIHLVVGRLDNAEAFFCRVAGDPTSKDVRSRRPMPGATRAQLAFATFGRGAVLHAHRKESEAKEAFLASLKAFGDGSWHDETLYRVATITQDLASAKFGSASLTASAKAPEPASPSAKPPAVSKAEPLTTKQREAAAKAEEERLATLLKAKGEALPYWQELMKRYPKSPRVEQAMYNAGVLLCELAEVAPSGEQGRTAAARAEKAWKDAAFMLNRFCEFYPKSLWAGDAYVRQVSMATGRMFDLDLASTIAQQAVGWAKDITEGRGSLPEAPLLPAWCLVERYPTYASLRPTFYDCYQWAGLVAHLRQQQDQAVAFCRQADRFDDSLRSRSGGETAMARMIAVVQGARDALTPEELLDALKDDKQKTGILLADLSLMTFDPERAGELYERLLSGGWPFPRPTPEVESYLFLRIGQALEFQRKHDEAMTYLKRLYDPKYAKYPWTADGIFRIGTWAYNATQDPDDAMKHWEYVFKRNPKHPEAERSLFYYGLTAMRTKEYRKAAEAFTEYLNRYPDSRWTKRVETELLPQAQKGIKENRG